ncbi:hypothetical protein DL96DRAFT_1688458, partial [Flagelloscypha sp. PMI_526]
MGVPQELVPLICSYSDPPTLASMCLAKKAFCLDARFALYLDITLTHHEQVRKFLRRARRRLKFTKHLSLIIPNFDSLYLREWRELITIIPQESKLISLKLTSLSDQNSSPPDFRRQASPLLSIPTLKYVAVATSVIFASVAIQCPALKVLEFREVSHWNDNLARLAKNESARLNTLYFRWSDISPTRLLIIKNIFNLSGLTRLGIHEYTSTTGAIQLLEMTCGTLEEVSLGISSGTLTGGYCLPGLHNLAFPNLKVIFVHTMLRGTEENIWVSLDLFISTMVSISGPHLGEFRIHLNNISLYYPIIRTKESSISHFHSQITTMRLYCWDRKTPLRKAEETKALFQRRFGLGRDFQVVWSVMSCCLTPFGELQAGH